MEEIIRRQKNSLNAIIRENELYSQVNEVDDLEEAIGKAKLYHQKLVNIKRSMLLINDRTIRLKRQTARLLEEKKLKDQEIQQSLKRKEMLERLLEPVVNTKQEPHPE